MGNDPSILLGCTGGEGVNSNDDEQEYKVQGVYFGAKIVVPKQNAKIYTVTKMRQSNKVKEKIYMYMFTYVFWLCLYPGPEIQQILPHAKTKKLLKMATRSPFI